jgi:hypothetical protein
MFLKSMEAAISLRLGSRNWHIIFTIFQWTSSHRFKGRGQKPHFSVEEPITIFNFHTPSSSLPPSCCLAWLHEDRKCSSHLEPWAIWHKRRVPQMNRLKVIWISNTTKSWNFRMWEKTSIFKVTVIWGSLVTCRLISSRSFWWYIVSSRSSELQVEGAVLHSTTHSQSFPKQHTKGLAKVPLEVSMVRVLLTISSWLSSKQSFCQIKGKPLRSSVVWPWPASPPLHTQVYPQS